MGEMREICRWGDLKVTWNKDNEKEVEAAEEIFNEKIEAGWSAFREKYAGAKGDRIKTFDPNAGRIILVPQVAGG